MPAAAKETGNAVRVGDDAVKAATGKTWPEWFEALDAAGARQMSHREIVAVVREQYGVGSWWQQMVTVGYEQERGLRALHERPDGYQISVSKTVATAVERLFEAWLDAKTRAQWLPDSAITIRKATVPKSIRITWPDGRTSVEATFYPKADAKTQVTAQHSKLASPEEADRMKSYWSGALSALKDLLEA